MRTTNFIRRGRVHEGPVANCADPTIVRWPGTFAVKVNRRGEHVIQPKRPVVFDAAENVWRYA